MRRRSRSASSRPASTLFTGGTVTLSAVGIDAFGNVTPTAALWTASPEGIGTLSTPSGATTTFTAGTTPGVVQVTATITTPTGTLTATSSVTVTPPPVVRVGAVRYGVARKQLHVYVTVVDTRGRRVRDASVTVALYRNGKVYARAPGTTTAGNMTFIEAGVDRHVPHEGHAGPRREPGLGRRHPGQRVRQEAGREAREEACAPEAVARVASRACLTAQRASPSVVSVRSSPDPVDDSAGTTVIRREYRSACR